VTQAVSDPSPVRIALISGCLKLGGPTTFLCNLGTELLRREIQVEAFSFEHGHPLASDFKRVGIPVFLQDHERTIFEDRLVAILRQLRRFAPSIVLANLGAESFEVLRYVPKGVFRVGVTHTDHAREYEMVRHYAGELDLLGAVSRAIHDKLRTMPEFSAVDVKCLPLGVPMPEQPPSRDFSGPIKVLYLGRLARDQKRVHLLPRIFADLESSGIPFEATIAGTGPDSTWLTKELEKNRRIRFPGKVAYSDVPKQLLEHDVFLLPSDYEGLPLGLVEAMGAGLVPVVSNLSSGVSELVDENTGKTVDVNDVAGYAKAIVWLHNHRQTMNDLSRNARARVSQQFSTAAMADRWLAQFPKTPARSEWPSSWSLKPVLTSPDRLRFSFPGRIARRVAMRFKMRAGARR
jgi:glycosyltransferase involved in cell wall biosynthesis